MTTTLDFSLEPQNKQHLANLCGENDSNIQLLSERLNIQVFSRGHQFRLVGTPSQVQSGRKILENLYKQANKGLGNDTVHLQIMENLPRAATDDAHLHTADSHSENGNADNQLYIRTPHKVVRTRGGHQRRFVEQIRQRNICFGIGPAGTGKTYLAVACAIEALTSRSYERLIITRPAVEAGEKLGFLPGDFSQKVDPYLRPVFDALYDTLGFELTDSLTAKGVIEIAPLAFMRGRSFNNAFILLDEGQNTTIEQMKMFLTRMGYGSSVVVTGDPSQTDLAGRVTSGLIHAVGILEQVDQVQITRFTLGDIVRHPMVQSIVQAYAKDLAQQPTTRNNHDQGSH